MSQIEMSGREKKNILVVDDSVTVRKIIAKQLGDDYVVFHADNGDEAWQILQSNDALSLVFLDLHMPVMNGMILLKQIRESDNQHISSLPVIMITGHKDSKAARIASRNMGATDFISKPFSSVDIVSRAKAHAKSSRATGQHKDNPAYDSLTELLNKQGFEDKGEKGFLFSQQRNSETSLLLMQIKGMDEIVSTYGQEISNQIILSVTRSIKSTLRGEDILAHMGDGHFAILLSNTNAFKAHIIAMRIQNSIKNLMFKIEENTIEIKMAVGLNSSENYDAKLTFTELCVQTEKALHASLQHRDCKIIRRAELFPEVPNYDISGSHLSGSSFNDNRAKENSGNAITRDLEELSSYMPAILKGEFDKIPAHHLQSMIKPLQSCLDYANSQLQSKVE